MPTLDHAAFRRTRNFAALDGVRGLMVVWVLLHHCEPSRLGLQFLRQRADFAVDVFFALSGFLVTTQLLRAPSAPLGQRLGGFYARRWLRIAPLYCAAILVYLAAVHAFGQPAAAAEYDAMVPSLLGYWFDWKLAFAGDVRPQFVQAWTLSVEEKFWLLWPLAVLLWPRRVGRIAALGIAAVALWRAVVASGGASEARLCYSFDLRLDGMLWGALLAALAHSERWYPLVRRMGHGRAFALLLAGLVACGCLLPNADPWRYVAVPALATALVAGLVVRPDLRGTSLLRSRMLRATGAVSYGVYVLHPLCLQVAQRVCGGRPGAPVDGLFEFALGAPLSFAVAWASYRWFEGPFLRLRSRWRSAPVGGGANDAEVPASPDPSADPAARSRRKRRSVAAGDRNCE